MKTETITWHELPQDGMPDADTTVLVDDSEGTTEGWFDGTHWRYCESGGVAFGVTAWAHMPAGVRTC